MADNKFHPFNKRMPFDGCVNRLGLQTANYSLRRGETNITLATFSTMHSPDKTLH